MIIQSIKYISQVHMYINKWCNKWTKEGEETILSYEEFQIVYLSAPISRRWSLNHALILSVSYPEWLASLEQGKQREELTSKWKNLASTAINKMIKISILTNKSWR